MLVFIPKRVYPEPLWWYWSCKILEKGKAGQEVGLCS
jgi:hypothetical protein